MSVLIQNKLIFMEILIVEPESSTVLDLKNILKRLGHNIVAVAVTGEEAIKRVNDLNPDLILIDLNLNGEISGVEAAKQIQNHHKIPIIFLTVFYKNCLNKSLQLSEDAIVLSKPIKQEHLEYCIQRAFSDNK